MVTTGFLDRIEEVPGAAGLREASYELLGLGAGQRCVDVGCGAGHAVAELTGRGVRAIGVDPDAEAIAAARERVPEARFEIAASDDLPLDPASVDGYRAARLLHLLTDPGPTLREARRVLGSGGRIVLVGQDYGFLALDATDDDLSDVILLALQEGSAAPRAARGYRNLLLDHGFGDVEVEVRTQIVTDQAMLRPQLEAAADRAAGRALVTRAEADRWIADQRRRGRRDRFFAAVPIILAAATRP